MEQGYRVIQSKQNLQKQMHLRMMTKLMLYFIMQVRGAR